jgi:hypothetical protein
MKPKARAFALVAMAGTLCAASVFAEESATRPTSNKDASAMRVVVDPETGEVRAPTADELKQQLARESAATAAKSSARSAAASRSTQVLPAEKSVQRHSNGMLSVRLSRESLSLIKATSQPNGELEIEHAEDTAQPVATEE